jgi:hypothetical protein
MSLYTVWFNGPESVLLAAKLGLICRGSIWALLFLFCLLVEDVCLVVWRLQECSPSIP